MKGVILEKEDIYDLTFEELRAVVHTHNGLGRIGEQQSEIATSPGCMGEQQPIKQLIRKRKDEFKLYEKLTPPRVLTSDGETLSGAYKRANFPAAALIGLPISSGVLKRLSGI